MKFLALTLVLVALMSGCVTEPSPCTEEGTSCCSSEGCQAMNLNCVEGKPVFKGCDDSCQPIASCETLECKQTETACCLGDVCSAVSLLCVEGQPVMKGCDSNCEPIAECVAESQEGNKTEQDPDLVAYWSFDSDAIDSVSGFKGTVHGAAFSEGKKGNAISFDGIDDHVDLGEALGEVGTLSQGTIAFWFKYENLLDQQEIMPMFYIGNKEGDDNIFIIEIGHTIPENYPTITLDPSNMNLYTTWIKSNQEPFLCFDSKQNIPENEWQHFAVVVGSSGNTGYLNGEELISRRYNFGKSSNTDFLDSIPVQELFTMGYGKTSYMISPGFVYFKGMVDELRIYDKPLSSEEIQELL